MKVPEQLIKEAIAYVGPQIERFIRRGDQGEDTRRVAMSFALSQGAGMLLEGCIEPTIAEPPSLLVVPG